MRAHQPTAKSKVDAVSRARMILKSRLWWLEGFPHGGGWAALPLDGSRDAEPLALDRAHLRRALRAVSVLRGEFPRALPHIVGDADRWEDAARRVLSLVAPWVHSGAPPPASLFESELYGRAARSQARALAGAGLDPVLAALSWVLATRASDAPRALRWLARNPVAARAALAHFGQPDGVVLAIRLAHLGATLGERLVAPLAALAAHPRLAETPLRDRERLFDRALDASRSASLAELAPAARIASRLPAELTAWTAWLTAADPGTQRRFLRLLGDCELTALLDAWSVWWDDFRSTLDRAARLDRSRDPRATVEAPQRLRLAIHRQRLRMPPQLEVRALGRALRALGRPQAEPCIAPARAALARVPASLGLRAAFVVHWGLGAESEAGARALARWLGHLRDHLRAAADRDAAIRPFVADAVERAARGRGYTLEDELDGRPAAVKRFFAALAALSASRPDAMTHALAERIAELVDVAEDPGLIADLAAGLCDAGEQNSWFSPDVFRAALALWGGDRSALVPLTCAFRDIEHGAPGLRVERLIRALIPLFADDPEQLRRLVVGDDRAHLIACCEKLAAAAAMGEAIDLRPTEPGDTAWISEHPARLHPALQLLAGSSRDAEAIARRAIGAAWRSGASLERERDVLARQVAEATGERRARLQARLASLTRQLGGARPPPERILRRLDEKLRRRAALERLRTLQSAADERLGPAAARYLGLAGAPDWMLQPRALRFLPGLTALRPSSRALAREVLRARAGPEPWDLRDHPANRAFLGRLAARAIDVQPWIDGIGTVERETPLGRIRLALEDDPLEVLLMGSYFETCLSPGAFNFFSAVTNAADINKRVLYARSATGTVVGRRLFCLTDDGALLVFHPYCHDERAGFDRLSGEFAGELARRMGTRLASRGRVSCLVAAEWYDDGPSDLTGQLDFMAEGSRFRTALAAAPLADVPAAIEAELGAGELDPQVSPMILDLPELTARPELVHAILPLIRDRSQLSDRARVRAAWLLEAAGSARAGAELFGEAIERSVERQFRSTGWSSIETIGLLCRIAPGRGLRALRVTRPPGIRGWDSEEDAARFLAGAIALERLHRPAQALALLRRAATANEPEDAAAAARQRLREVE